MYRRPHVTVQAKGGTHLSRGLDSLPETEVDNGEDEEEAECQLPADSPHIPEPVRVLDLQNIPPVM